MVQLSLHGFDCKLRESILNVYAVFGWGLEEDHIPIFLAVLGTSSLGNASQALLRQVKFVPKDQKGRRTWLLVLTSIHKVLLPVLQPLKALRTSDVIHHTAAISAPIERRTQWLESLLASSVPYLQNAGLVVNYHLPVREIGSNGWFEVVRELAFLEEVDEWRFAYTAVPNDNELDEHFAWLILL